jgi:hypothetical protein
MARCSSRPDPTQASGIDVRDEQPVRRLPARHPSKDLFSRENRRISHGCIRVENPRELAALLMQQPIDAINQVIATDRTTRSNLPTPMPIFVAYETAFAGVDGSLEFRADVYGRDGEIGPYLNPERRAVVERGAPYRRGG